MSAGIMCCYTCFDKYSPKAPRHCEYHECGNLAAVEDEGVHCCKSCYFKANQAPKAGQSVLKWAEMKIANDEEEQLLRTQDKALVECAVCGEDAHFYCEECEDMFCDDCVDESYGCGTCGVRVVDLDDDDY
jgi:hypothetical protein